MDKRLQRLQIIKFLFFDFLAAALAWFLFINILSANNGFAFNKFKEQLFIQENLILGLIVIPFFWLLLYYLSGSYKNIFRRSRLGQFGQTIFISVIGVLVIYFVILLDQAVSASKGYYQSLILYFALHLFFTSIFRFILSTRISRKIHKRIIGFNTIIVGSQKRAIEITKELESQKKSAGNKLIGFVNVSEHDEYPMEAYLPRLGSFDEVVDIIEKHNVEEAIIAMETRENKKISRILTDLYSTEVVVKIIPEMHDILLGSVKMTSIFGTPLIQIQSGLMPAWQQSIKRFIDILVSIVCLILLSPVFLITAIIVKLTSRGPVFYKHERIGRHGKPFMMHKFRSMYVDAEKNGPQLSCADDPRITPFGRFMRKVRLDEIPQFYNVLRGYMSLVGPRPERQFYIDQIVKKAPEYKLLQKIKPGVTSWGQVKYGYAENVDEMIERLKYDLLYLENMSLSVDFKIMIYTVLIIVQGRGQ
ncbi:MAG: sugar transferase [Bacteroidia bacterium]|nr:MAG: sugar transferase [Bacteroidia bacterium]